MEVRIFSIKHIDMKRYVMLFGFLTVISGYSISQPTKPIERKAYLEFARSSADWVWNHYDSLITAWKKTFDAESVFGYRSPGYILEMASIYAFLYDLEGKKDYAERAKKVLLQYDSYKQQYPADKASKRPDYTQGVPALPDFFTAMRYIKPYEILVKHGLLSKQESATIRDVIAQSMTYLLQSQEWGAMNRSALRAETLGWATRVLPDHPKADDWRLMEQALVGDNWGQWEIEDATIYHGVWLYALMGYADAKGTMEALFQTPQIYYYARYFLNLLSPDGMIPDFGDAAWRQNWERFLVFFETAASQYHNPEMKWAAVTIGQKFIDLRQVRNIGLAYNLLDCYRWGTDAIKPLAPTQGSMEVMDDIVGKKMVFRNGWDPGATYLLLNYRDEGDGGLLFRNFLRDGIPVEEEKMTHGHADENSIVLLMNKGSVLLHDGGYRDFMPSGPYGAYRQDYFHNRLCIRQEKIFMGQKEGEWRYATTGRTAVQGQPVLDFLHNAGSYRVVRTQKIDFLTFPEFDYSRTRLIDDKLGYEWDRVIVYLKNPEMFVVFDIMKSTTEEFFTAANLWHTQEIISQGEHWYDTRYKVLGGQPVTQGTDLLICFPRNHYRLESVEKEQRNYSEECCIAEYTGQHFELGQHIGFVTVLIPHPAGSDVSELVKSIRYETADEREEGMSLVMDLAGQTIRLGVKADLRMDMIRDFRRPKYTYESGRLVYGPVETNADFFYTSWKGNQIDYTMVNFSKAYYQEQLMFEQPTNYFGLAFDGSPDVNGTSKVRYWRGKLTMK
jgi:hypothetical protein